MNDMRFSSGPSPTATGGAASAGVATVAAAACDTVLTHLERAVYGMVTAPNVAQSTTVAERAPVPERAAAAG